MPAQLEPVAEASGLTRMALPNGRTVLQLNPAETSLQYRDIVTTRAYLQHGLAVRAGDTVVDVGANVGLSCLFFHWEAPGVRIVAVEPVPQLFAALRANLELEGVRASALCCGLSSRAGEADLTYYPEVTVMTSQYGDPEHDAAVTRTFLLNTGLDPGDADELSSGRHQHTTVPCELRTLSQVIAAEGIERIDLLKINVEKAEHDVLAGINEPDWRRVRQITMQVHDIDDRVAAVRAELERRGFRVAVDQDPLLEGTDIFDLYAACTGGEERA